MIEDLTEAMVAIEGENMRPVTLALDLAVGLDDQGIQGEVSAALGAGIVHTVGLTDPTGMGALQRAAELARVSRDRSTAVTASRELAFVEAGARGRRTGFLLKQAPELAAGDDGRVSAVLGIEAVALADGAGSARRSSGSTNRWSRLSGPTNRGRRPGR